MVELGVCLTPTDKLQLQAFIDTDEQARTTKNTDLWTIYKTTTLERWGQLQTYLQDTEGSPD